jgi:uncharacterized protein (DUF1501 family)
MSNNNQRRHFLRTATSLAVASGLPTLDALNSMALAAGPGELDPASVDGGYKAIVCVFLFGAQDAHNVLIPYSQTEYDRYAAARAYGTALQNEDSGNLSYARTRLASTVLPGTTVNSIPAAVGGGWTTNTFGREFALHPNYTELKSLYSLGKLAVIANTGPMLASINRDEWYNGLKARPTNLYSHSDQQGAWMSCRAQDLNPQSGVGGRIAAEVYTQNGTAPQISTSVSTSGTTTFFLTSNTSVQPYQVGTGRVGRLQTTTTTPPIAPTVCNTSSTFMAANTTSPYCVSGGPVMVSNGFTGNTTMSGAITSRINAGNGLPNVYLNQWNGIMNQSRNTATAVNAAILASPPTEDIVSKFVGVIDDPTLGATPVYNPLAAQLQMVAALIRASTSLGTVTAGTAGPMKRQIFFVGIGGFDTHGAEFWDSNPRLNTQVSKAVNAFWQALGTIKVTGAATATAQDAVTLFTMSDFGRTLDSNGFGCDHGYAGHHIVLGGAVNGGYIYGKDHNITAAQAGSSVWLSTDTTAGAVPRVGIPPNRYDNTLTAPGSRANGLNHSLSRGEMLPTMASEAYIATIARWFGIAPDRLATVFPNLAASHPDFNTTKGVGFMSGI